MDAIFWIGLILGALLSFAASVAANIYNNKIQNLVEAERDYQVYYQENERQ